MNRQATDTFSFRRIYASYNPFPHFLVVDKFRSCLFVDNL